MGLPKTVGTSSGGRSGKCVHPSNRQEAEEISSHQGRVVVWQSTPLKLVQNILPEEDQEL